MGAWGAGAFDNDTAMDWIGSLLSLDPEGPVRLALQPEQIRESPALALAASGLIATACGYPSPVPDHDVLRVASTLHAVASQLTSRAAEAVRDVRGSSELAELWADSDDNATWQQSIETLLERLSLAVAKPRTPPQAPPAVATERAADSSPSEGVSRELFPPPTPGALIAVPLGDGTCGIIQVVGAAHNEQWDNDLFGVCVVFNARVETPDGTSLSNRSLTEDDAWTCMAMSIDGIRDGRWIALDVRGDTNVGLRVQETALAAACDANWPRRRGYRGMVVIEDMLRALHGLAPWALTPHVESTWAPYLIDKGYVPKGATYRFED